MLNYSKFTKQEFDYDAAVELKKQYNDANKQYERLNKAIDEV